MVFSNIDFNFANFANFEIEKSFGFVKLTLQNGRFHLKISISGI